MIVWQYVTQYLCVIFDVACNEFKWCSLELRGGNQASNWIKCGCLLPCLLMPFLCVLIRLRVKSKAASVALRSGRCERSRRRRGTFKSHHCNSIMEERLGKCARVRIKRRAAFLKSGWQIHKQHAAFSCSFPFYWCLALGAVVCFPFIKGVIFLLNAVEGGKKNQLHNVAGCPISCHCWHGIP